MADTFPYADIRFADVQLLRYRVPDFQSLSPRQRCLVWCLSEAALWGRDILWDQNCRYNLPIRHLLEAVYRQYPSDRQSSEFQAFEEYLFRVWFANGIHHHYAMDKFRPGFSRIFLEQALRQVHYEADPRLLDVIFSPDILPKRVSQTDGTDLLLSSACNYYAPGITQCEAEEFYRQLREQTEAACPLCRQHPPMYGMNSRLERDAQGRLFEHVYSTSGRYGATLSRIVEWFSRALGFIDNEAQRMVVESLIKFYSTGNLHDFDNYTILWVAQTEGDIDFTNGFTEVYGDPLGLKASWEGYVNLTDHRASERTRRLSENAQWFEDNSPTAPQFKKTRCHGVSARVVQAAILGGDLYPSSAIGINLPNSNWVRQEHGSKSVTIGNLTEAYARAARGNGFREEFVIDATTLQLMERYEDTLDDLHTDLHECLGHGSGQLLPDVSPDALGTYGSAIEEARADLFALYFIADPMMLKLGLVPDAEAYRSQYYGYMMNGLLTQLVRIEPGQQIEEAHMRNRALIARWVLHHSGGAMQLVEIDGRTFLRIDSYPAVRRALGVLLAEVQRIKSEGDFSAARHLVEDYGVSVDARLHAEVLQRYRRLNLAPYKGFINPRYDPVLDAQGHPVDVQISYVESYAEQMLRYGQSYSLPQP